MSLLAKVFVVIMTVLIMVYLGVSATLYQHRRDWRNSYAKLKERYKTSVQYASKEIEALRNGVKAKDSLRWRCSVALMLVGMEMMMESLP